MNLKTSEPRLGAKDGLPPPFAADFKNNESRFIDLIRSRLGITIHSHQSKELQKTILKGCAKFSCSPTEYLQMLTACPPDSPLLEHLVTGVTIGETYFFRDKNQMQMLQQNVLPKIIARKRQQHDLSLRIWSAGCASGEEVYTLAMMLTALLPDLNAWAIHLLGTDINTQSLQKALVGRYKEWSMRAISADYKNRYFAKIDDEYEIMPQLKNGVSFFYLNLNDDAYPSITNGTNAQDLILCRNVLIYFDSQRVATLMKKFSLSLVAEGYLLLGASDPVNLNDTGLHFNYHQSSLFSRSTTIAPPAALEEPSVTQARPAPPVKKARMLTAAPRVDRSAEKPKQAKLDEQRIQQLLTSAKWQEILDQTSLNDNHSAVLLNAKATALANLGKLQQAVQFCESSLALDKANKATHFLHAMILLELNKIEAAEAALRKTIFLDHAFVFAHFQLGLLLFRNKKIEAGAKCLKNALTIAKKQQPEEAVTGVYGLHYGRLVEILEHELELNSKLGSDFHETQK